MIEFDSGGGGEINTLISTGKIVRGGFIKDGREWSQGLLYLQSWHCNMASQGYIPENFKSVKVSMIGKKQKAQF